MGPLISDVTICLAVCLAVVVEGNKYLPEVPTPPDLSNKPEEAEHYCSLMLVVEFLAADKLEQVKLVPVVVRNIPVAKVVHNIQGVAPQAPLLHAAADNMQALH